MLRVIHDLMSAIHNEGREKEGERERERERELERER